MLLQTMGPIYQHRKNKAEGVKKVHRLTLWNASTNHGLHSSAQAEKGLYSQKVSSPCSEGKECFYNPWVAFFITGRTRLTESKRLIALL
jgi:hypothetical protein